MKSAPSASRPNDNLRQRRLPADMTDAPPGSADQTKPNTPEEETRAQAYEPVIGPVEDELFGKRIRKSFGPRAFWGTIVDSYVVGKGQFYKVSFDDGDVDILAAHEVQLDLKEASRHKLEDPSAKEPEPENAKASLPLGSTTYQDVLRAKKISHKRRRDSASSSDGDRIETSAVGPWQVQLWSTRLFATIIEEDGYIRIQNFVPMANGEKGEMESTGKVKPGDALLAVQGQVVHGRMDHIQACDLIRTLPRPLKLAFFRPIAGSVPLSSAAIANAIRAAGTAMSSHNQITPPSPPKKPRASNEGELPKSSKGGVSDTQGDVRVAVLHLSTSGAGTRPLPPSKPLSHPPSPNVDTASIPQPEPSASISRPAPSSVHASIAFADQVPPSDPVSQGSETIHQHTRVRSSRTPSPHVRAPSPGAPLSSMNSSLPPDYSSASRPLENGVHLHHPIHESLMHQPQQLQATRMPVHVPTSHASTIAPPNRQNPVPAHFGQSSQHGQQVTTMSTATSSRMPVSSPSVSSFGNGQIYHHESRQQHDQASVASRHHQMANQQHEYNTPSHSASVISSYGPQHPVNVPTMHYSANRAPQRHDGYQTLPVRHSELPLSHHVHLRDSADMPARHDFDVHRRHYPEQDATRQNMTLGDYMTYAAQQERLALRAASSSLSTNLPQHARQPPQISASYHPRAEYARQTTTVRSDSAHLTSSFVVSNHGGNKLQQPETPLGTAIVGRENTTVIAPDTSFLNLRSPSFVETTPIASKPVYAAASKEPNYRSAFAHFGRATSRPTYLQRFESSGFVEITITQPRLYLTLAPMGQYVSVSSFVRGDSGEKGEIESSGKVLAGDILVGIGPVAIPPYMSPSDVARIVASRPRPYVAYFIRATWEMLQ